MEVYIKQFAESWAIILGGSSGFGLAAARKLAAHGMNIALLYREMASAEKAVKQELDHLEREFDTTILPFNLNALNEEGQQAFIQEFHRMVGTRKCVRLLLHSIARGNLRSLEELSAQDIHDTTHAMGTSMLGWAKLLLKEDLFQPDARIIGLTSEGAHKYWEGYAAVSVAKASLESLSSYMAVDLAPYGIRTNIIQAGVTNTPSLKKIPGSEELLNHTVKRNPFGRTTSPADVANVIYLLCTDEASWVNGALIHVDGGEHCR
ncbi:SDR family oxidoreductase [Flavitalea sp. BT771]|uniref:SDR family oxidoreductase n=1 Tax=Flavitalea sp. BT771 TaxID=3063329 RepID=UPI0026E43FB8|nr:SDR family oxidoreductase [Flavitalea sp. BT771]MDO6429991.1 SDR family oxidoreductase [Flavitalea sp. BT771]MDV6217881.1 SDR family oxidoreductase [Flavitalea sp. BT771]